MTVKIAVLIKQVPDTDEVKMDPETGTMVREGVSSTANPLDLNALEEAVQLKSRFGGEVTAISMGPPQAEAVLREAIARGADRAVLLTDRAFAGSDTWATSVALSRALELLGPFDLVLCGEKSTDGETGQVGPEVASLMGLPFATYVRRVEVLGGAVRVERALDEGLQTLEMPMPCLVAVTGSINVPSMPTLAGKKRARQAQVERLSAQDLGVSPDEVGLSGSPTRVVRTYRPVVKREGRRFGPRELDEAAEHVLQILRSLNLV